MTKSKCKRAKRMEDEMSSSDEGYGMIIVHPSRAIVPAAFAERIVSEAADMDMTNSILALEHLLGYRFHDQTLLVQALTHSSYTEAESYQRLEFVGDAVLGLAITNHIFLTYPDLDPGQLSTLRAANISTEKLARVAIRHNLYSHLRRNAPALDEKVREFADAVRYDPDEVPYDGKVKAPKVLADVVESIAAAVYVDCGFDLKVFWLVFRALLEPIVTTQTLQQQPVTMLFEFCQKIGKKVDIRFWKKGMKTIANVYVDGRIQGSGWSEQKDIAKLNAAKAALQKLQEIEPLEREVEIEFTEEGAKQRLNELCSKNRWSKPSYKYCQIGQSLTLHLSKELELTRIKLDYFHVRVEKEEGPAHGKVFICSVQIEVTGIIYVSWGDRKSRVKDAENSAACSLLNALSTSN